MDKPLNYIEKIPRAEVYKNLMRELNTLHLRRMIEDIARDPEKTFDLADTPLKGASPAEINSVLEELGWHESECWFDDEYGCSTYTNKRWGFSLCMSFDGFEWTVHLFRGEWNEICCQ